MEDLIPNNPFVTLDLGDAESLVLCESGDFFDIVISQYRKKNKHKLIVYKKDNPHFRFELSCVTEATIAGNTGTFVAGYISSFKQIREMSCSYVHPTGCENIHFLCLLNEDEKTVMYVKEIPF